MFSPQRYTLFFILATFLVPILIPNIKKQELEENFNTIHLKYTHITKLPDFVKVQQLHSSCAFIEVIFEGDAAVPGLDFTAASPKTDVDGFGTGENFAECGDVDYIRT